MRKIRAIVCGGRDFNNKKFCFECLDEALSMYDSVEIVSGHAKGADIYGEEYAREREIDICVFKPDWKKFGRGAGPIRNRQMLDYALKQNAVVIAFWDGVSKGTANMIEQAKKAGAVVHIFNYN